MKYLWLVVLWLLPILAEAQHLEGANWLFGANVHLNFKDFPPKVDKFSFADTTARSVATISDRFGNLLFFSSGLRIGTRQQINGVYQEMPGGSLVTSRLTFPPNVEMIVKSPADSNIYYIFFIGTTKNNGKTSQGLHSVQIDMRLNNGYGDIVAGSLEFLRKRAHFLKLTALLHQNNRDTWILTQNPEGDSLFANLLTPTGIKQAVITKLMYPKLYTSIKGSPNSELLAIMGEFGAEVFNFNRTTGAITPKYVLPSPNPDYPFCNCAFSPDNSKLYTGAGGYSNFPPIATIYQFDLAAGSAAQVVASRNVLYSTTDYGGIEDMQLAADGKIYVSLISGYPTYITSPYLSQISCPDFYGQASRFKFQAIDLKGPVKRGVLPALNQTLFRNAGKLQAQATRNVICAGDSVQLAAFGVGAEHFEWDAANGLTPPSDTLSNPFVSPTVTTTYKVIGSSACRSDTAFVKITVLPKPGAVSIAGPVQVYEGSENQGYLIPNALTGSNFTWQVNGGAITKGQGESSISVTWGNIGDGTVTVTEINASGCAGEEVSLKVRINDGPEPEFYDIFTPDNDGRNDAFVIENLKWYPENELRIYNRWGVEVYRNTNYQNNWQAENLSGGVYYYYFRAKGKSWKGWVEIVKK